MDFRHDVRKIKAKIDSETWKYLIDEELEKSNVDVVQGLERLAEINPESKFAAELEPLLIYHGIKKPKQKGVIVIEKFRSELKFMLEKATNGSFRSFLIQLINADDQVMLHLALACVENPQFFPLPADNVSTLHNAMKRCELKSSVELKHETTSDILKEVFLEAIKTLTVETLNFCWFSDEEIFFYEDRIMYRNKDGYLSNIVVGVKPEVIKFLGSLHKRIVGLNG